MRMPTAIYTHDYSAMMHSLQSTQKSLDVKFEAPPSDRSDSTASSTEDLAKNVNSPVLGWPFLAKTIAENSDLEAFSTFKDLSIKSLLYYQAELIFFRNKLHEAEYKDHRQPDEPRNKASKYATHLHYFISDREKALKKGQEPPEQWILIEKIRTTLEKYHAALLQFSKVSALGDADNCNVRTLRNCCRTTVAGVRGTGSQTWGDLLEPDPDPKELSELSWGLCKGFFVSPDCERIPIPNVFQEHLIVPHKGNKPDGLTQWVKLSFIPFYDHVLKRYFVPAWKCIASPRQTLFPPKPSGPDVENPEKRNSGLDSETSSDVPFSPTSQTSNSSNSSESSIAKHFTVYPGSWIVRITSIMTTVVACLLPTVAITILARVHSMGLILGLIALFTAIFAIGLVLLSSSSSRVEIFTATAAFSAVMVVFVQNQIGPQ